MIRNKYSQKQNFLVRCVQNSSQTTVSTYGILTSVSSMKVDLNLLFSIDGLDHLINNYKRLITSCFILYVCSERRNTCLVFGILPSASNLALACRLFSILLYCLALTYSGSSSRNSVVPGRGMRWNCGPRSPTYPTRENLSYI